MERKAQGCNDRTANMDGGRIAMGIVFAIVGTVAAVLYHIYIDPFRALPTIAWSTWQLEVAALHAIAGFVAGWLLGDLISDLRRDE
jgi:predicted membrane protein